MGGGARGGQDLRHPHAAHLLPSGKKIYSSLSACLTNYFSVSPVPSLLPAFSGFIPGEIFSSS